MCSENKSIQNNKGDDHMNAATHNKQHNINDKIKSDSVKVSHKALEQLIKNKIVLKSKDGKIQINKKHPEYDFWMED